MSTGMYRPPLGARPVRTVYEDMCQARMECSSIANLTSSKESSSDPPRVEKYLIEQSLRMGI